MRLSAVGLAPYVQSNNFKLNIPNKPIEYMSAGLPVAASLTKGVLPDLLREHNCGFSYENAADLVSKLLALSKHPEELKSLSQNATQLYQQKFVAEKVYEEMINYLEFVMKRFEQS
jgi:glycosyltransferase involved in cell wall biosynthesis